MMVFLNVGLGALEDGITLLLVCLTLLLEIGGAEFTLLFLRLAFLEDTLRSKNLRLGWDTPINPDMLELWK